ncbi:MAG TPA: N-acetylmuramoyl-L-alanine amidase [Vicinamibacterales bacterium]|nr:N-acetylmuramoyl-L-alanine amidase [Vicinamibacterales bacterium]
MRSFARATAAALVLVALGSALQAQSSQSKTLYNDALGRERTVRRDLAAAHTESAREAALTRVRALVGAYEDMSRLFPTSGYSDNALWQGAVLSADAFWQFGEALDRTTALRMFTALTARFPSSSLVGQVTSHVKRLSDARVSRASAAPAVPAARAPSRLSESAVKASLPAALVAIRRDVLPEVLRITLELGREVLFYDERIDGPPRVFLDLRNTRAVETLKDAVIPFSDDLVKQVRVGRQADSRTRVVLDLQTTARYSVYTLYDPYRIVVDFERTHPPAPASGATFASTVAARIAPARAVTIAPTRAPGIAPTNEVTIAPASAGRIAPTGDSVLAPTGAAKIAPTIDVALAPPSEPGLAPIIETREAPTSAVALAPAPPSANTRGGFSLSRQLGLGIARIVVDPGHGGHDPGAKARGLTEADLVLDVALRLEKLLLKEAGVEVVLTRRTNTYVSLEERTAIANRVGADLFLSIHSNASANDSARGVETYFLNFAPNPEAEAVAARENAGGAKTMRNLPDIVRAIALNNKIDESRDFASMVQSSLYSRLQKTNRTVRNLGVKQAPFMVLIGATMPSILAEISFITNRREATLLKTDKYKQQIAEALLAGVLRYQQALKKVPAIAAQRP